MRDSIQEQNWKMYRLVQKKGPVLLSTSQAQRGRTFSQLSDLSFARPCSKLNHEKCDTGLGNRCVQFTVPIRYCDYKYRVERKEGC